MNHDLAIARATKLKPIAEIAAKLGVPDDALEPYGRYKAKIGFDFIRSVQDRPDGALVLVSGISPTPAGEGKTTTTVGLADALNHIGITRGDLPARTEPGAEFRPEGGRCRRRPRPGRADGGNQSPLHRRLPRHHRRQQPARGDDRQPHLLGQCARHRHPSGDVAACAGCERPGACAPSSMASAAWPTVRRARTGSISPWHPR